MSSNERNTNHAHNIDETAIIIFRAPHCYQVNQQLTPR